jgi:hypothetical protein
LFAGVLNHADDVVAGFVSRIESPHAFSTN